MTSASPSNSRARICARICGAVLLLSACAAGKDKPPLEDTAMESLALTAIHPEVILPGTAITLEGESFVTDGKDGWGDSRLHLQGEIDGRQVELVADAHFVDFSRLEVDAAELTKRLDRWGKFEGEAYVTVDSRVDGRTHWSPPLEITVSLHEELEPTLDLVDNLGALFVNDPVQVEGSGLLFGDDEGQTTAVLEGCFTRRGADDCEPIDEVELPVVPDGDDRSRGTFLFGPEVAGVVPGRFEGTVFLRNTNGNGAVFDSDEQPLEHKTVLPAIIDISPKDPSLHQWVDIRGGGFVFGGTEATTEILFDGTFAYDDGLEKTVDGIRVIPEVLSGTHLRYALNESDAIARKIHSSHRDLRRDSGTFSGTVTPLVSYPAGAGGCRDLPDSCSCSGDNIQCTGDPTDFVLRISPIRQVVYFNFLPSYRESLRRLGLRAIDELIRKRALDVVRTAYAGINVEVRAVKPDDFDKYAVVEIAGPDDNGMSLFGYDNTPGKDVDNKRLWDQIGGANAATQEDGFPGYGGVFVDSLLGLSMHPPDGIKKSESLANPLFDQVFDPLRPDRDGRPVMAADIAAGIPELTRGRDCPAPRDERDSQIACAIWVLGSIIGTTVAHELGHSLGLAEPYGSAFHNIGDQPDRLMDAGGNRPFTERAELEGDGPGVFCEGEYQYLQKILPLDSEDGDIDRPPC